MKRIACILAIGVLSLGHTGCQEDLDGPTDATTTPEVGEPAPDTTGTYPPPAEPTQLPHADPSTTTDPTTTDPTTTDPATGAKRVAPDVVEKPATELPPQPNGGK